MNIWYRLLAPLYAIRDWCRTHKRKLVIGVLVIVLSVLSFKALNAGGGNDYDWQSLWLVLARLNMWVLAIVFYRNLMAAMGDDDLEADWQRINDGNIAVALYRLTEFAVMGITAGLLISKI